MCSKARSTLLFVVVFVLVSSNFPLEHLFNNAVALSSAPPPPAQTQITLFDGARSSNARDVTQSPKLFPEAIIGVRAEWYRTNLPDEDVTFTAQIHYPFPEAEFFTDAEHAMTWGDYIDTCTHQADQHLIECTGRFPASDPTQIMLAAVDFYILGTCELYPDPPDSVTAEAEIQYSDDTDDSTSESVPVAPRIDLVTVADSPANNAIDVVIESGGNGPLLQWQDNTSGYACGPIDAISPLDHDITYGAYLNASGQAPQQIGDQNGECSRQIQLAPNDLACDENGDPQVWEWTIRAVDIKYSVCTPTPVQDTTFRFTTASCQPEITQVAPQYGNQYFLNNISVDNTYRVEVDWNGPAYQTPPSAPIDGQVYFEINGVEKPENGVDGQTWGAEHTFNMGQDFQADWSGGNNAMKIWAEYRPEASGPVYKSDYHTAQPIVFPFPEWATTIPIGPFTIDAKEAVVEYENEAQYPDPAFEANVDIPQAVPYLGGKELGILESQATAGIAASSAGTGKLSLGGETGLGLGAFEIIGEIGGEGEFKFQQNDGLKMEKATLELGISTPFKKEMTLADLVPAIKAAEDWWLVGKLIRKVTRSIVVEGSITPKISIAADFEQQGRTEWEFVGSVLRGQLELKVVATFKPYEKLWVQVYGGGTPFIEFNLPANPDYFRRMGIDLLFGAKLHAWRWDKEFKYGVTCALPGGCNSNDDLRRVVALNDTGWELLPRAYVNDDYNLFVGNAAPPPAGRAWTTTSASASTAEIPLVNNVYPLTEPALAVRADGHKTLAYIVDDLDKPLGQGEELAVLQGTTLTQTAPLTLTDDYQLDFAPQVVYDGAGNAVVAWERSYTDVITSGLNMTFAQQIDIAATAWMSDTGSWSSITMLTEDNGRLDHSPRLRVGSDGYVMALWQSGDGTDILGTTAHPITYTYATWDGTSWSTPPLVALGGLTQTLEMDVAVYSATQAALVYVVDTDGELSSGADTELYYSDYDGSNWSAPLRLTADTITDTTPALIYDAAGDLKLLWLRGTDLVMLDGSLNIADVQRVRADSAASGFQDLSLSRSPAGHLALLWQEMYEDGADLAYSVYDANSGRWGTDQHFMHDTALETALAPAFADDGTLYLAYRKSVTEYVTDTVEVSPTLSITVTNMPQLGRSDLYLLSHTIGRDLTIRDLAVMPPYPAAGETVTLTAQVHNVGDLETGPIDVRFDDGADAIITVTVAPTMTAGTWVTATTTWSAPTPLTSPHTLRATVDPGDAIDETFEDNNTAETVAFGAQLIAESAQRYYDTETLTYTLALRNEGSTAAEAPVTVTLRADTPNGAVLASTTLTTDVEVGASSSASIVIPDVSLLEGLEDGWMVVGTPQAHRDNAWPISLQILPDLIVHDIQEAPPTVQVANVGVVTATDVDLMVWRDVTAASLGYTDTLVHNGTLVFSATLGDLAPGQTITADINLLSGDTPELWAQVDPHYAINEGNETNNLKIHGITAINLAPHLYVTVPPTTTVGSLTALTATVGPPTITLPMTYTWQTTDYAPVVHPNGGLSDTLQVTWVTSGTKHVTVTARNAVGDVVSDTRALTVEEMQPGQCVPMTWVTIDGPDTCAPDQTCTFTTMIEPTATRPILYTWDPLPQSDSLILPTGQSMVTYTWDTPGTYTLTVTAQNCGGEGQGTDTHTIMIQTPSQMIYLPLIHRGYVPPPTPDRYAKRYGEDSGDCSTPATACGSIQYAIDQAQAGDVIGIAGYEEAYTLENPDGQHTRTYWEVQSRPKPDGYYGPDQVRQVALIEKSVTLYGGYSSDFSAWNPGVYKTVLRPGLSGGDGRVILIAPGASPTLEWLYILEGDTTSEGGAYNPFYDYQSAGGGIAAIGTFDGDDSLTMRNCVIAGNVASQSYNASGGGVYLHYRNNAVLENNAVYSNTATLLYGQALGQGGGLNISSSDNVRIERNAIHHNQATTGYGRGEGAGLRASSSNNLRVTHNEIYQNLGNDNGGGIHLRNCNAALIQDNRIYDNVGATQSDGLGGGINLFGLDAPVIQNNEISGNVGTQSTSSEHVGIGGGIYLNDVDHAVVSGNVISGNVAHLYHTGTGGGVATYQCPSLTLDRNLILYNVATPNHATNETAGGGGLRLSTRATGMGGSRDTYVTLTNNVIARNQAPYGGGGIILLSLSDGSHVYATLSHNTIADNGVPPTQAFSLPRAAQRSVSEIDITDYASHAELWALAQGRNTINIVDQVPIEAQGIMVIRGVILDATNNILSGHTRGVYVYEAAENTLAFDYTLWHGNTSDYDPSVGHTHDQSGDPAYVGPSTGDYHIGAASAARDQGTDASITVDMDGEVRPQGGGYDIGADEFTE